MDSFHTKEFQIEIYYIHIIINIKCNQKFYLPQSDTYHSTVWNAPDEYQIVMCFKTGSGGTNKIEMPYTDYYTVIYKWV